MAVTTVTDLTRPPEDHYYEDLLSRYGQMRQFVPTLLRTVVFDGTAAGRPVLDAVAFLRRVEGQRKPDLSDTPRGVVTRAWRSLVLDADNRVDRHGYTFCVLDRLRDGLRRHDVFVTPSERWADSAPSFSMDLPGRPHDPTCAAPSADRRIPRSSSTRTRTPTRHRLSNDGRQPADEHGGANRAHRWTRPTGAHAL